MNRLKLSKLSEFLSSSGSEFQTEWRHGSWAEAEGSPLHFSLSMKNFPVT